MNSPNRPVLLYGDSVRNPNIFYKTGFLAGDPFCVVDDGAEVTLWVGSMEYARAKKEAKPGVMVRDLAELPAAPADGTQRSSRMLRAACKFHNTTAVTVDRDFPALELEEIRAAGINVEISSGLYARERRIKNAAEIEQIASTQMAGLDALDKAVSVIRRSRVRGDILYYKRKPLTGEYLVRLVESRLLELGCAADSTIICGAPDNRDPHRSTSDVIRAGMPIVLDIFPYDKNTRMWGDMTRTVVRGKPKPGVKEMYDAVLDAQMTALSMVKPGVTGAELDRAAREVLKKHGYDQFIHGLGHGVGLEIHELPSISAGGNVPLEEGDVITIEPGNYDPVLGGIRIEDTIVITATGYRQLTPYTKQMSVG